MKLTLANWKPKTVSSNKSAYIQGNSVMLDFKTSKVVIKNCLDFKMEQCWITQKNLFDGIFDEAQSVEKVDPLINIPADLVWNEMPMNIMDVGAFNAPASAGEDIFWYSHIAMMEKQWLFLAIGSIYLIEHKMPKILKFAEQTINFPLDYNALHYLNQMFKNVTKTKPKNLKVAITDSYVYLTEEESGIYIIIDKKNKYFETTGKSCRDVTNFYHTAEIIDKERSLDRVQYAKTRDSIFKHVCKALDVTISRCDSAYFEKFFSENSVLYLNKRKSNE